jgi:hypothetical protein
VHRFPASAAARRDRVQGLLLKLEKGGEQVKAQRLTVSLAHPSSECASQLAADLVRDTNSCGLALNDANVSRQHL